MDKIQQLLTHFRMVRASTLMMLRGLQQTQSPNQEVIDELLDRLNEIKRRIEILENQLKSGDK